MSEKETADLLATLAAIAQLVRARRPVVHQITNYVSATDCANITLAAGGVPIMADELLEMAELIPHVDALVLNMGVFHADRKRTVAFAAKIAAAHKKPIVLDPAGAGTSRLRRSVISLLLENDALRVVRGNVSETEALLKEKVALCDVRADDMNLYARTAAEKLAGRIGRTVAVTGGRNYFSDGQRGLEIGNGHALLNSIIGTGCMASSLTGACLAVEKDPLLAAAAAGLMLGVAAEKAAEAAAGPGSFHAALFDAVAALTKEDYLARGRVRLWGNWICEDIANS